MTPSELAEYLARYPSVRAAARMLGIHATRFYPWLHGTRPVPAHIADALRERTPPRAVATSSMQPAAFEAGVRALGSLKQAARVLGCSTAAAWNYAHGRRPVPPVMASVLRQLVASEIDIAANESEPTPT